MCPLRLTTPEQPDPHRPGRAREMALFRRIRVALSSPGDVLRRPRSLRYSLPAPGKLALIVAVQAKPIRFGEHSS
jgi:hypothetical protein